MEYNIWDKIILTVLAITLVCLAAICVAGTVALIYLAITRVF